MAGLELKGIGASAGIAIGPAHVFERHGVVERVAVPPDGVEGEVARLRDALGRAREQLVEVRQQAARGAGEEAAAIFDAHLLMLEDPELAGRAEELIREERAGAEWAVDRAAREAAELLAALPDEYLRARAADLRDVADRVIAILRGQAEHPLSRLTEPVVVVSRELTPSDTVHMDRSKVLGFVMEGGSHTSHAAILARTLGIPAVVGVPGVLQAVRTGDTVVADGEAGLVVVSPGEEELAGWLERRRAWTGRQDRLRALASLPAVTLDGHRVELAANIGSPADLAAALAHGAEGVGLFRTEFLFMDRDRAADEEEQFEAYRQVAEALGGRPVIIRTLDVGGDKEIPWLGVEKETNPFLGLRGIRLCLARPDLFLTQLRAILRARARGNVWVMFPMVAQLEEVRAARRLLGEAAAQLKARGVEHDPALPVGIMVEVPSAALMVDELYGEVDFVSIGTNDLTQYTLAADRTNPRVAGLGDALHPAVLRLIARVGEAARGRGKWAGVCGDLAGDPLAAPVLLGLGMHELSMAPPCLPAVKEVVRAVSRAQAESLARAALRCESAAAVRGLLREHLAEMGLIGGAENEAGTGRPAG